MSILSLNCCGLGDESAVGELFRLIKVQRPRIVFLMETKLKKKGIEEVKNELKIDNVVCVDRIGMSGGLALFWDSEWDVKLRTLSKSHIDVIVIEKDGVSWRLIGIYGHPKKLKRIETWNLMRLLHQQVTLPWICIGDFNEILSAMKNKEGNQGVSGKWRIFEKCWTIAD